MELDLYSLDGGAPGGKVTVPETVFGAEFNEALVHQVVTAYLAGARSGTKAQKSRSDVKASGAKPWRQKGLGRARAGSRGSPLWRGGGVTFAARPRSYAQKVNRKMYRGALRAILSELVREQRLLVVDRFGVEEPRTRLVADAVRRLGVDEALIVVKDLDEKLYLAVRNLPRMGICDVTALDPLSLVRFDRTVITRDALDLLQGRLA